MRFLVDECLPRQLRQWLLIARPDWTVTTVQEAGWAAMKNGILLRAANGTFDVLGISVLVLPTNRAKLVRAGVLALVQSLPRERPGE